MTRYVIAPEVALHLARNDVAIAGEHQLVAPKLLRSQVLSLLYQAVRRGEAKTDAERHLDYVRRLRIRLLPEAVAWKRRCWDGQTRSTPSTSPSLSFKRTR
jgi:hypothetical protein